jgi:DNA-nicking Smr family endonuclease
MTRRKPTPSELELWHRVAQQADRLHPERRAPLAQPETPKPKPPKPAQTFDAFEIGQRAASTPLRHDLQPSLPDRVARQPVTMDRKNFTRMKRGKLKPEGRIDLHGMTLDRAHPALTRFILAAQSSGKRLVLVITGKGRTARETGPIPTPRGILKHQVPHWLGMPPLAQAVLQVSEAHVSHGGGGAYYVYLRRPR